MNVAVVGASDKPDRYSHLAVLWLKEKGHTCLPVNPLLKTLADLPVYPTLADIPVLVHTVTIYLSAGFQKDLWDGIIHCGAKRVIFNPGAENPELADRLRTAGIEVLEACTLVLLRTGQF